MNKIYTMQEPTQEISNKKNDHFSGKDLMKIITDLFGNSPECGDVKKFILENKELLKRTVGENKFGIERGSTAFHILAKKGFDTTIITAYKYQFGMFRDIYSDIQKTTKCIHDQLDDEELVNAIREINIVEKLANNVTALEVAKEEPENKALVAILENAKMVEAPIEEKMEEPAAMEEPDESKDVLTFKINKDVILEETEDPNRKIIKIKSKKNTIDKGYKITRPKTKKLDEPMAGGRKKRRSIKRRKNRKRKTAKK
jgi:hypothetical protein